MPPDKKRKIVVRKNPNAEIVNGGITVGPSHADGGIKFKLPDGSTPELEGGEGVVNATTMASKKIVTVVGTPAQIVSKVNSMDGHGVDFEPGAKVKEGAIFKDGGVIADPVPDIEHLRKRTEEERCNCKHEDGGVVGPHRAIIGEGGGGKLKFSAGISLSKAKSMKSAGAEPQQIWQETGWEFSSDGFWKYDISDLEPTDEKLLLDEVLSTPEETVKDIGKLSDWFKAGDLFIAYPEMKEIGLEVFRYKSIHYAGTYDRNSRKIKINGNYIESGITSETMDALGLNSRFPGNAEGLVKKAGNNKNQSAFSNDRVGANTRRGSGNDYDSAESFRSYGKEQDGIGHGFRIIASSLYRLLSVIIHEIQHYIQEKEGFALGGSNDFFKNIPRLKRHAIKRLKHISKNPVHADGSAMTDKEVEREKKLLTELVGKKTWLEDDFQRYWILAGETEARNAEFRRWLSPAFRKKTRISQTDPINDTDKLFLYESGGKTGDLLAPNGKLSSLNPVQHALVRTDKFIHWFGDWLTMAQNPPSDRNEYLDSKDWYKSMQDQYVKDGKLIKSGKEKKFDMSIVPAVGTWRIDSKPGFPNLEFIDQLREVPIELLEGSELDKKGNVEPAKRDYVEVYAKWMKSGEMPPPLEVVETSDYKLRVVNGNRRLVAARRAGLKTLLCWVSPIMAYSSDNKMKWTPDGKLIKSGMTYSGAMEAIKNCSKVVDDNGEPLVVYHGTDKEYTEFSKKKAKEGRLGKGFYFTSDTHESGNYGKFNRPFFLRISELFNGRTNKTIGGGKYFGVEYTLSHNGGRVFMVDSPTQIKLADGSNTEFNPTNPDIRFEQGGKVKGDRSGNLIGDGSFHAHYTVFDFSEYREITSSVSLSDTTESVYVTYSNSDNGKYITVRFSNHENNAVRFGDQLDGNFVTRDEVLYHLGLRKRIFIPNTRLLIWTRQVKKTDIPNYQEADKTIVEMYEMGEGADISIYKDKLAKNSNYLILGDTVEKHIETGLNYFGKEVQKGRFVYEKFENNFSEGGVTKSLPIGLEIVNGFYSPIEKSLLETKLENKSAKGWLEFFGKGDEVIYTGLKAFLESKKPTDQIKKSDIVSFLKDNRIEIVEVVKGGKESEWSDDWVKTDNGFNNGAFRLYKGNNWKLYNNLTGEEIGLGGFDNLEGAKGRAKDEWLSNKTDTKFSQYQLEGEKENYKEVLVTLPTLEGNKQAEYDNYYKSLINKYGESGRLRYKISEEERQKLDSLKPNANSSFKSSHFDEPNILVHLRMNTRTDAEGKKVLFLEEVQSDWGQKGKKEGFKGIEIDKQKADEEFNRVLKRTDNLGFFSQREAMEAIKSTTNWQSKVSKKLTEEDVKSIDNWVNRERQISQVSSAPFVTDTNAWTKLGLKVALKEAVKQGVDKIAWTTGEQQNDRYDLSKQISEIHYSGTNLKAYDLEGKALIEKTGVQKEELPDIIGKDVAKKLLDSPKKGTLQSLVGLDLKVGGKGMIGFYGSPAERKLGIVGEVAKSLTKQELGEIQIESTNKTIKDYELDGVGDGFRMYEKEEYGSLKEIGVFKTREDAQKWINENNTSTQHSITITPEIIADLKSGLPLFMQGGIIPGVINFGKVKTRSVTRLGEVKTRKYADGGIIKNTGKILPAEEAENADVQFRISNARSYYTLWVSIKHPPRPGNPRPISLAYIAILSQNHERAIEKAWQYAKRFANGESIPLAFVGDENFKIESIKRDSIGVINDVISAKELEAIAKVPIASQQLGMGKYASVLVADLPQTDMDYVDWMVRSAYSGRMKEAANYLKTNPEYLAWREAKTFKEEEVKKELEARSGELLSQERINLLKSFKIEATIDKASGGISLDGKTYDWKDTIKGMGGRWTGKWTLPPEGFEQFIAKLEELAPQKPGKKTGVIPTYVTDPYYAELRKKMENYPDLSKLEKPISEYVAPETIDLLHLGEKYGMPKFVVDEQVEDVAKIVNAYESNMPMFLLASQPGSGKTFVLGGAIRELKRLGAKTIVYVTLRKELIQQILDDLVKFDIGEVEFITYPELRTRDTVIKADVLIFDEAHAIKNVGEQTQQARKAASWIRKARFSIFSTATPFENPLQVEYAGSTGVFNNDFNSFEEFALTFGARKITVQGYDRLIYKRGATSNKDLKEAREYFRKKGMLTTRKTKLPPGLTDVRMAKVKADGNFAFIYTKLTESLAIVQDGLVGYAKFWFVNFQKRLLEASKIKAGIREAEFALAKGRFPIIFVETKAERIIDIPDLMEKESEYEMAVKMALAMHDKPPPRSDFGLPPEGVVLPVLADFMNNTGIEKIIIPSAEDEIQNAFGKDRVAIFTGSVSPAKAQKNLNEWRAGTKPLLVATMAKGGTGLSLHDKVGDHPTTQININLPWTATQVTQVAQRSARYGLVSKAEMIWLFTEDINFDKILASRVGGRMADMGAIVAGEEIAHASNLEDWDFDQTAFSEQLAPPEKAQSEIDFIDPNPMPETNIVETENSDLDADYEDYLKSLENKKFEMGGLFPEYHNIKSPNPKEYEAIKDSLAGKVRSIRSGMNKVEKELQTAKDAFHVEQLKTALKVSKKALVNAEADYNDHIKLRDKYADAGRKQLTMFSLGGKTNLVHLGSIKSKNEN